MKVRFDGRVGSHYYHLCCIHRGKNASLAFDHSIGGSQHLSFQGSPVRRERHKNNEYEALDHLLILYLNEPVIEMLPSSIAVLRYGPS